MAKPPALSSRPGAVKKPASKPNAARNKSQTDALLRSKKKGNRQAISARTAGARGARTPAAMIAALHDIRPLGHELATNGAGKGAWDKTIDDALRAWEAVQKAPAHDAPSGPGMPKSTKNTKGSGFPDICKVPAPPAPFAPVPFPNVSALEEAGADAGPAAEGAADAAGGAADDASDVVDDAVDAAGDAADAGADAADDAADAGADAARDTAGQAQDAGTNAVNTVSSWLP